MEGRNNKNMKKETLIEIILGPQIFAFVQAAIKSHRTHSNK